MSSKIGSVKIIPNYIVTTQGWSGREVTECFTVKEVWAAKGRMSFGGKWNVSSPANKPLYMFVTF